MTDRGLPSEYRELQRIWKKHVVSFSYNSYTVGNHDIGAVVWQDPPIVLLEAVYLPSYLVLSELNLLDSYTGLIVSNCVSVFSIFLIRQAFMQVSHELVEAGQLDGASRRKSS